jgi:hypothetical protein
MALGLRPSADAAVESDQIHAGLRQRGILPQRLLVRLNGGLSVPVRRECDPSFQVGGGVVTNCGDGCRLRIVGRRPARWTLPLAFERGRGFGRPAQAPIRQRQRVMGGAEVREQGRRLLEMGDGSAVISAGLGNAAEAVLSGRSR